jgi:hypothetical protein
MLEVHEHQHSTVLGYNDGGPFHRLLKAALKMQRQTLSRYPSVERNPLVKTKLMIFNSNVKTVVTHVIRDDRTTNICNLLLKKDSKHKMNCSGHQPRAFESSNMGRNDSGNHNKRIEMGWTYAKEDKGLDRKGDTGLDF